MPTTKKSTKQPNQYTSGKTPRSATSATSGTTAKAQNALSRIKQQAASEVGVNLKSNYNGDLTSKQAGSVGGQMVKKMVEAYKNSGK
jgi:Small, acid-soluble spore proteins, alpha/beta type.